MIKDNEENAKEEDERARGQNGQTQNQFFFIHNIIIDETNDPRTSVI